MAFLVLWTSRWTLASFLLGQVWPMTYPLRQRRGKVCFEKMHGQNCYFAPQLAEHEHFKRHFENPLIQNRFSCSTSFTCCSYFSDKSLVNCPLARDRQGIDSQAFIAYLFIIIINWVLHLRPHMLSVILRLLPSALPTTAFGSQPWLGLDWPLEAANSSYLAAFTVMSFLLTLLRVSSRQDSSRLPSTDAPRGTLGVLRYSEKYQ